MGGLDTTAVISAGHHVRVGARANLSLVDRVGGRHLAELYLVACHLVVQVLLALGVESGWGLDRGCLRAESEVGVVSLVGSGQVRVADQRVRSQGPRE